MKRILFFFGMLLGMYGLHSQVAINHDGSDPAAGTILHVKSAAQQKPDVVIQDATGYMGIGTLNPQDRLDVWGGFRMSLDENNYVRAFGSPTQINGVTVMEGLVQIEGNAIQRYAFLSPNPSGGVDTLVTLFPPTGGIGIGTNTPFPGNVLQINATDDQLKGYVVVRKDNGYVGIGTPFPQNRLDIWGKVRLSIDTANYMLISAGPTSILGNPALEGTATLEGNYVQRYAFLANKGDGTYDTIVTVFRPTGAVGIGTNLPMGKVHVHINDQDIQNKISSMGLEYNNFDAWQGLGLLLDTVQTHEVHPFLGYGPHTKFFTIIQFTDTNRTVAHETRMIFLPQGFTGIGDPNTHEPPDAALTVSNGPIWHTLGIRAPILTLKDYDGTVRVIVDADGNMSFPNGGGINIATLNANAANVAGDLNVNGDAYVNDELYADKASIMTSLAVAGTTSLEGDLEAKDAMFDGTVIVGDDLSLDGKMQRQAQGNADLLPVAYGVVDYDGTVISGTGNFTVTHSDDGEYYIEVTNETITNNYTVTVTAQGMDALIPVTTDDNGKAVIYLIDLNGDYVDGPFQFVIYRP